MDISCKACFKTLSCHEHHEYKGFCFKPTTSSRQADSSHRNDGARASIVSHLPTSLSQASAQLQPRFKQPLGHHGPRAAPADLAGKGWNLVARPLRRRTGTSEHRAATCKLYPKTSHFSLGLASPGQARITRSQPSPSVSPAPHYAHQRLCSPTNARYRAAEQSVRQTSKAPLAQVLPETKATLFLNAPSRRGTIRGCDLHFCCIYLQPTTKASVWKS